MLKDEEEKGASRGAELQGLESRRGRGGGWLEQGGAGHCSTELRTGSLLIPQLSGLTVWFYI